MKLIFFDKLFLILFYLSPFVYLLFIICDYYIKNNHKLHLIFAFLLSFIYFLFIIYSLINRILKYIFNYQFSIYNFIYKFINLTIYFKTLLCLIVIILIYIFIKIYKFVIKELEYIHKWLMSKKWYDQSILKILKILFPIIKNIVIFLRKNKYLHPIIYNIFKFFIYIFYYFSILILISLFFWDILFNNGIISKIFKILPFLLIYTLLYKYILYILKEILEKTNLKDF